MPPPRYDKSIYNMTPPRELDEDDDIKEFAQQCESSNQTNKESPPPPRTSLDPDNISDVSL